MYLLDHALKLNHLRYGGGHGGNPPARARVALQVPATTPEPPPQGDCRRSLAADATVLVFA